MLMNIPKVLSPELLKVLCEMGHGDTILLGDGNYPGAHAAIRGSAKFVRADGIGVPQLLDAILQVFPLDAYTDTPVMLMGVDKKDVGLKIPIQDEFKKIVAAHDPRGESAIGILERYAYYDKADTCYCIVQTGEEAIYANVILQKGVVK